MSTCLTQSVIAQSSGEAEYYAIGTGAADSIYLKSLLQQLHLTSTIRLFSDASTGRTTAMRRGLSKRLRHMDVKVLFIQSLVENKVISIHVVAGKVNPANMSTKFLSGQDIAYQRGQHMVGVSLETCAGPESAFPASVHYLLRKGV